MAPVPARLAPEYIRPAPRGQEERLAIYPGSLHHDRLDQAGVIILDVADPHADRPAYHFFRRVWREQNLEPTRISGFLTELGWPRFRAEDHRHPIVKLRAQLVGRCCDDREAPHPLARR